MVVSDAGNRRERVFHFVVLGCLYTAQTLPGHFATNAIPIIMRREGLDLERIGLFSLVGLPWALKFLWAPVVDRYGGNRNHYRRWAVIMQLLFALATLAASFYSLHDDLGSVAALMALAFTFSATQDIAVDAYAVKMLKPSQRAMGNAIQTGANMLGVALGSSAAYILYLHTGWQGTLTVLAILTLMLGLPMVFAREASSPPTTIPTWSGTFAFFCEPSVRGWIMTTMPAFGAIFSVLTMCKPLLVDNGYDPQVISLAMGIFPLTGIPAALLTGMSLRRWGTDRVYTACCLVAATGCCTFIPLARGQGGDLAVFVALAGIHAVFAMLGTVLNSVAMEFARPGRGGTDYTLFTSIPFAGAMICVGASGLVAQRFGYVTLFAGAAVLIFSALGIFFVCSLHLRPVASPAGNQMLYSGRVPVVVIDEAAAPNVSVKVNEPE